MATFPLWRQAEVERAGGAGVGRVGRRRVSREFHLRDAEIEHLDGVAAAAIGLKPEVVRLQVTMNDAVTMRLVESEADLIENLGDEGKGGPRMLLLERGERLAVEQFHHKIGDLAAAGGSDSEVRDVDDVGVAKTTAGLSFPLESAEELGIGGPSGRDDLDGNDTGGSEVGGEVDVAHTAGAELAVNAVFGVEDLANHGMFRISGQRSIDAESRRTSAGTHAASAQSQ